MDQHKRTVAKALSWQSLGLLVMTGLGYLTTGSWTAAGGLAVSGFLIGSVTYILHEKLWARVKWGRMDAPAHHVHPAIRHPSP